MVFETENYHSNKINAINKVPKFDILTEYLNFAVKTSPNASALKTRRNGELEEWTYKEYKENIYRVAKSLLKMQLTQYSSVNINSYNNPEWFFIFFGCIFSKYLPTGIYCTSSPSQCQTSFNESNSEIVFVEDEDRLNNYIEIKDDIPKCKAIILMESLGGEKKNYSELPFKVYHWSEFLEIGNDINDTEIDEISASIKNEDLASFIFTSGTTSKPKLCMISHKNYVSIGYYGIQLFVGNADYGEYVFISYLPLSHIADQITTLVIALMSQSCVIFGDRNALKGTLINTLKEFKPSVICGVPRIFEKIQTSIENEIKKASGLKKFIINWAMNVGLHYKKSSSQYKLAEKLVFKNIYEKIGFNNIKIVATGSAPLSKNTNNFFKSIGISIGNTYGLSETTGCSVIESPEFRLGSCGKVNNGEIKIANDGEVLLKGDFIFKGYYNNQQATDEVIDSEGWLHTGDVGTLDKDGYLFITDRKKEIIITSGGENIAPTMIEKKIGSIPGVEYAVIYGDKQKFLVAIITLNLDILKSMKLQNLIKFNVPNTLTEASNDENIQNYIKEQMDLVNKDLARVQTIKRFKILPCEFVEIGQESELTPTKKLKRKYIYQKYFEVFKSLYNDIWINNN
ncbi:hypothetical protein DICPUDRAFT_148872 [Dictyostelium purpureum]|uniref:AMP-dependent synthetase/ligase domain-containing protein n=1 Tax=Dictyostelium purpureum TaxID=5786 RepID=F0ZC80_DICPU|nr:uncharacterized protein DICPUDRAFT_148872 [Dictyostelium purpureum]EGC38476.1 hypothetical protein DICPUDRAFT_148872 [Dictyostelium purpureum]|eukprot:XP_003285034.1 hypothetical protein DICPUDRAFT_148872 [Dictyostelium purpureum]